MQARNFRFGVVAGLARDGKDWLDTARLVERLGYSTFLGADTLWTPSPFPSLSAAAAVTSTLRIGTHVLAVPFRTPVTVARDTAALDLLSDGRFELGLGTGRPDAEGEAERLGMPFGSAAERLEQVAAQIAAVRAWFAEQDRAAPPIMLAGSGPKLVSLAAEHADILTLPFSQAMSEDELPERMARLRSTVGDRLDRLELAMNVFAIGDEVPQWMRRHVGDLPEDSVARLRGSPRQIADVLKRRRDELGISYVTVAQPFAETFAPVVELLS